MGNLLIRNLDDRVKSKIRVRAARHGRSMEEEARRLLTTAVQRSPANEGGFGTAVRRRFASLGSMKLERLPRETMRDPPKLR